jgi:hypothetical protein
MMVSNFRHISTYSGIDSGPSKSWFNFFSLKTIVCIIRYLYIISLMIISTVGIILG